MSFRSTISTIIFIMLFQPLQFAQELNNNDLSSLFGDRGEIYFSFQITDLKKHTQLSSIISIDEIKRNEVYAYASKKEFAEFLQLDIPFEKHIAPGLLIKPLMKNSINLKGIDDWDFYPTYEAYVDMMYQFETNYPDICEVINIGETGQGRELLFVRISDNIGVDEGEAQFMYTSTMHGDETTGYPLMLRLIDSLLTSYGTSPRISNMIDNLEIFINPLANPDGTYITGNNSVNGAIRFNANYVDLNRNYPDPEDGPHPDGNAWQDETLAFMAFAESNHFTLSCNIHGGTEVCNYPWDTWSTLAADDDWWQYVNHEYADTAQLYSPGNYMNEYNDGITNGYAWYSISGGRQDYMNYFHQCREFTLEISDIKLVPASSLPDYWEYNRRSFLNYIEQTMFGIAGTITDAATGDPLIGEVFIENHDMDSSWVYSMESSGNYFRPVFQGTYDVTFSADGYYPQTIENISTQNKELTIVDVQLNAGDLIPDFAANMTTVPVGSNIDFSDLSFGGVTSWEWTFEGGTPSTSNTQNPNISYNAVGSFDVSLTISDGTNTQTITKEDYITANVEYVMQNTTVSTCEGIFYDTGGAGSEYGNNENFTMTFLPSVSSNKIEAEFTSFNVEFESSCDYDWLKIYDGTSTSSPLISKYCGTLSPWTVTATNDDGALTFQFYSDGSVTESGWVANISCIPPAQAPVADFTADLTSIIEEESIVFTDLSQNNPTSWEWTFEGGTPETSNDQNPEITYSNEGVFDVSLTVSNSFGSDSYIIEDYITVAPLISGVGTINQDEFKIYPNPAKDKISVSSSENIKSIEIISLLGKTMKKLTIENDFVSINVSDMHEGIYFMRIDANSGISNWKFQVRK